MNETSLKNENSAGEKIRSKDRKIVQWLITIFILTAIVLSLIGDKGFFQLMALKERGRKLTEEIEGLKAERKEWLKKIYSLKNNTTYIETIAREDLGMIGQDEILIELHYSDDPF